MELAQLLQRLCAAPGPSGREDAARDEAEKIVNELGLGPCQVTPLGSLLCTLKPGSRPVMLEAHLDQIGLVVTRVEEGFLRFHRIGGSDRRLLPAQRVTVRTAGGPRPGVVASVPPHLKDPDSDKPPRWEDMLIDTGCTPETAKKLFAPGDTITVDGAYVQLAGGRVACPALDDRAGCAAVLWAGKLLAEAGCPAPVTLALCSFEEIGGHGAATAAFAARPGSCYAVDVSFAEAPGIAPEKCGRLGAGPMIGIAPILNRTLTAGLRDAAAANGIPCQVEVMGGDTGTDADGIVATAGGIPTGLLSIPLRNMHTPVEEVELQDVENTARLMALAVMGGTK